MKLLRRPILVMGLSSAFVSGIVLFSTLMTPRFAPVTGISRKFRERLDIIVIPKVNLHGESLEKAVQNLNAVLAERTKAEPVQIRFWDEAKPPKNLLPGGAYRMDDSQKDISIRQRNVTLDLYNVPVLDALKYISSLTGCIVGKKSNTLFVVDAPHGGSFYKLYQRTYSTFTFTF